MLAEGGEDGLMGGTPGQATGLSTEEKRALAAAMLRERAAKARPSRPPVHRMFEARAARSPGSVAVVCGDRSLTYGELDARADRLAGRLRGVGVGPETRVGLYVERSAEMVVGLLAILKAGGAYLPLDPAFPGKRLALMVEDARLTVVLTEGPLLATVPGSPAAVLRIGDDAPAGDDGAAARSPAGSADQTAYVIYTSGSTGTPKGVAVTHGALSNFLLAMGDLLGLTAGDTLLAVTTLSFDIAALELFLPLIRGARLEIAPRDVAADGFRLAVRLDRSDVTFLQATPATWRMLLGAGWAGAPALSMLCGGEALPRDLAGRLVGMGKALWNLYGPTETTIWSSASRIEAGDDGPITIGRPIAETQFYVLDGRMRLLPPGIAGELYIGGSGLARGYLGRPGLTAERFVPDPFGPRRGARLYRTGDLARWRTDGRWECLGRVDQQVKVRGFRIELGEVESQLGRHPSVGEAAVVAREDATGEQGIVAFVTPRDGREPDGAELRRWLRESLPEYMVPSAFMTLGALPLTPNGKVDRRALPAVEPALARPSGDDTPPRGPIEEAIVQFWGELLGRPKVGAFENFFEVGGHSLLATQVLARVRDTFAVEASLREFLETPTPAGLALVVERRLREGTGTAITSILPIPRDGALPASFAQQRLWFLDQLEPDSPIYNMPVAVRLSGDLDRAALGRALDEVVRRHESLRTTFDAPDGVPRQVIGPPWSVPLPMVDLAAETPEGREAEARRLMDAEARRPFDLARGPLIRAGLIRLEDREHLALVTIHHIVSDAWSLGVLIREVGATYEAFSRGRPSPLAEPTLQYADYAAWQRDWLSGAVLQSQLDYWEAHLRGVAVLELPTDRPRPSALSGRGAERGLDLPAALVDQVRLLGRREGATLYMTLLAAFQVLLHRYSGQDDFAVGSPIAGRTRPEVADLIGFFVNTLVLRADLAGDPDFLALLGRARRSALGAYAYQDLPFEKLVAVLHPERDPARSPLFQALFSLQNAPLPALQTTGLAMKAVEPDNGTAKFDLALFAAEKEPGLNLTMQYSTDLFAAATVDQMLVHYRTLLEGIVADPTRPVAALPMLSDAERRRLLDPGDSPDPGLDGLSDEEVEALLSQLESGIDAQDQ